MIEHQIKIIYGGIFVKARGWTPEGVREVLNFLENEGIKVIDTAASYPDSEELLGIADAGARFTIDTKVDVLYIHAPDRRSPIKSVLAGINTLYLARKFKRFGLSNFNAEEVEEVIRVAKENGFVLPSIYQGNYNAVARRSETELMPVLHRWNISFYAYSPIAGGFLTKNPEQLRAGGHGRWDPSGWTGNMYNALYNTPCMLRALEAFIRLSNEMGISQAELAYRWVAYNSQLRPKLGDGIIIGARFGPQLEEALVGLSKGALSKEVADRIDALWPDIDESPLDNFEGYINNPEKNK
ncbi:hypothetical protein FE257_011098 [Aspergillus nanangensis]|uniref:NADP-dependent oxidoreductase domain-containing protein n=1 Tax=Aspergillus nanangensis TaxID=2582783 RepID=A0AAD4GRN1_ASPNN|nr:hypothetical protein FE257_011098 [Aspergillus nanangensis]